MNKLTLNPDREVVSSIRKKIKDNEGYCPCMFVKDKDTKCPCIYMRNEATCICGLYVKN